MKKDSLLAQIFRNLFDKFLHRQKLKNKHPQNRCFFRFSDDIYTDFEIFSSNCWHFSRRDFCSSVIRLFVLKIACLVVACGMVEYTPELRTKAKLADNITTLAKTMGKSREEYITIYRGTILKQKEINPGDFITTNPQLAKNYTGNGYVISKKVKLKDILNDRDGPLGEEYIYRPEKVLKADKGAKLLKKTERKFDENFRKISEEKFKKLQELVENNRKYTIRWNVSNRVIDFLKQEGLGNKMLTYNHCR